MPQRVGNISLTKNPEEQEAEELSLGAHSLSPTFSCSQFPHQLDNTHYMTTEKLGGATWEKYANYVVCSCGMGR